MNLFKGLLFLEGYVSNPHLFDDADFAPTYGNRLASERVFGATAANDADARRVSPASVCAAAGCS